MTKPRPELELLARWGAQARGETQPPIDVAAGVIQRIARGRTRVIDPRLATVAICASVLSLVAVLALRSTNSNSDGLAINDSLAALSEVAIPGGGPESLFQVLEP
jgi:hypothetical protein